MGATYALCGRTAEALPLLEQAVEQSAAMKLIFGHALRVAWLGEACLLAGRTDEAMAYAQQALDVARAHKAEGDWAYILRLLGAIYLRREPPEVEPAGDHLRQALALAEGLGMRPLMAHCHLDLGTLHRRSGCLEQARTELSIAIELYRAMALAFWLPQAEAELAQVRWRPAGYA